MSPTVQQDLAVGDEVRTSIRLIEAGLGELQRIDGANDFYHLPMLLLAGGFERLMKTIVCLHTLHETGDYPSRNAFPRGRKGHDLIRLLDKVDKECFSETYLQRPAAREDLEFLRTDTRLRELVTILSDFGQAARYYDLDIVLGDIPTTSSPKDLWEQVEMAVLREDDDWADHFKPPVNMDKLYKKITADLVVRLEMLARSLTRLFTIGGLGDEAKLHTGTIRPFLFLRDDELGKRAY